MFHHPDPHTAPYLVLAFYHFANISDPDLEVRQHKDFLATCDVTCRVYISSEGVNAQMCFARADAEKYMKWLSSRPGFQDVYFKIQGSIRQVFARVTVKKKELVSFGCNVDLKKSGYHASPEEWDEMLANEENKIVVDIRNEYEWEVGHFEGAEPVTCQNFREFQEYAEELKKRLEKHPAKVMMYCTGGIRCEYFSALLKEKGIDEIYQLDGGVINYGEKQGSSKWKGSLFVFDDRLTVPVGEGSPEVIGKCHHCGAKTDNFYNCANMDCNELFLCCESCLEKFSGCCKEECMNAPRLRPFQYAHTPFRRWYNYANTKEELAHLNPKHQANASSDTSCCCACSSPAHPQGLGVQGEKR